VYYTRVSVKGYNENSKGEIMPRGMVDISAYNKINRKTLKNLVYVISELNKHNIDLLLINRENALQIIASILGITKRSAWDYYYTIIILKRLF